MPPLQAFPAYGSDLQRAPYLVEMLPAANAADGRLLAMSQPLNTQRPTNHPGYTDYFSNDSNTKPVILDDGTSVQFPKDGTDEDADKWRKGMELERPSRTDRLH